MQNKLITFIRSFDLFGQPVCILINNRKVHQTFVGAFMSLIVFIIVIYSFATSIQTVLSGSAPQVRTYKSQIGINEQFTFPKNDFFLAIQVITPLGQIIPNTQNNTYFNVIFGYCQSKQSNFTCLTMPAEICGDSISEMAEKIGADPLKAKTAYCIPQSIRSNLSVSLEGQILNTNFSYIYFAVQKCVNSTQSNQICAPIEQIETVLQNSYVIYTFSRFELDVNLQGNPFVHLTQYSQFRISPTSKLTTYNYYNKAESKSISDFMIISQKEEIYEAIEYSNERSEQLPLNPQDSVVSQNFFIFGNSKITYVRTYDNFIDILSKVGGLFSLLTTILRILLQPYQWIDLKQNIVNKLNESNKQTSQQTDLTVSVLHFFQKSTRQRYLANIRDVEQQIDILEILKKLKNIDYLKKHLDELVTNVKKTNPMQLFEKSHPLDKSNMIVEKSQLLGEEGVSLQYPQQSSLVPYEPSADKVILSPPSNINRQLNQHSRH